MIAVEEAFTRLMRRVVPLDSEPCPLEKAGGRVLAADIAARKSQPAAALSAMDGYAVRATDLSGAEDGGRTFTVIGESAAGSPFTGEVHPGQAVRIFTGALVPDGAEQIVIQENAVRDGGDARLTAGPAPLDNIRPAGGDFTTGDTVLHAGARVTPAMIGLAAACGHGELPVVRRARVALISTGDELVPPGQPIDSPAQIYDSAGPMVAALLGDAGADIVMQCHVGDDAAALERRLGEAGMQADVVLTIGGASVGDKDFVHPVLQRMGVALDVWKIAMRPGKPMMFGRRGDTVFVGLPGNPASAFVSALLFVRPLTAALMGQTATLPTGRPVPLGADLPANGPRQHYMRARLIHDPLGGNGEHVVIPAETQDSSLLSVLAGSDGLIVRPAMAPPVTRGCHVFFIAY